ncbi:trehalose-phosphatase [Cordyceps militaris CM01]|uniref:Trehalose-phosphatase n=1 Tax=Cordyceps militaris (strain CM01) TaxID=983644 RepID=G3JTV1_CORMM|nr:trehalose-phosphatase [Cordyceps militaris CM01]EGX88105.1 trehalose-phosphatase [Cordyceps militaris CM01]
MSARTASIRPDLPQKRESEALARWRSDAQNVPVTPAFGHEKQSLHAKLGSETTGQDYFGQNPPPLQGNVISVTFTLPRILYKAGKLEWDTDNRFWRSGHLDCLLHLAQAPLRQTVIAWTGEINHLDEKLPHSPAEPSSTSIAPGGHAEEKDDSSLDGAVIVTTEEQKRLETDLYQSRERIVPVWLYLNTEWKEDGIELKNQSRWREYAEHDLYPLFHYKQREPTGGGDERLRWNDYHQANEAFADKICATYKPGDVVLVHDFYLMLVPRMVRQRLPSARIALILQTPFPTSEFARCLHRRQELLEGVLGADVVVFQASLYAEHFANSCARILETQGGPEQIIHDGRCTQLVHIPTGINIQHISQHAFNPTVDDLCKEVQDSFSGKKIILGHDPMNSLSGLDKKLQAYERFLHNHPEWQDKVVLVQLTSPALLEVGGTEEADFASRVNLLVGAINARYGSLGHTPVQLSPLPPQQDAYLALLRQSDVALITSVRQGISTTALEYAVCQRDARGTLVLSEFSGTAGALSAAVVINPWDVAAVADEIHKALTATREDKVVSHAALFRQVQDMAVERWARKLFGVLESIPLRDSHGDNPSPIIEEQ